MALDILKEKGTPLAKQEFDWRDLVRAPISKLDDDAFTRVRVILMNGIESEAVRFQHAMARSYDGELRPELARIRRVEHFQQTLVNWLLPPDQDALETTIGYEQTAIEVTAPADDIRDPYLREDAAPLTKLHSLTILSAEHQVHDYYMNIGPMFADPVARMLYAEIAAIEEQHVTQYECLQDPSESWLEKWLLHEATEAYNYHSCMQQEENPRIKSIWERFTDYELGHLHHVMDLYRRIEGKDPEALLPARLPDPLRFEGHRGFIREVLAKEADLRAAGTEFVPKERESEASIAYRARLNASGSPSQDIAAGYRWAPGTELRQETLTPSA